MVINSPLSSYLYARKSVNPWTSSERLLQSTAMNRDTQLVSIHTIRYYGVLFSKWAILSHSCLRHNTQDHLWRGSRKIISAKGNRNICKTVCFGQEHELTGGVSFLQGCGPWELPVPRKKRPQTRAHRGNTTGTQRVLWGFCVCCSFVCFRLRQCFSI